MGVGAGWLFLATVIDIATRRLIGWSINTHMRSSLVVDALEAAIAARGGQVNGVIFHSDKGSPNTAAPPSPRSATGFKIEQPAHIATDLRQLNRWLAAQIRQGNTFHPSHPPASQQTPEQHDVLDNDAHRAYQYAAIERTNR
ncbi:hypothetical protein GCM10010170_025100 [Dactylosporangium salmoneum]|uniref:Integrase catalytic domain-containing protein n=1 Tax=Dactylosporangium salmoneum TaxID=53361 RepID=A0ABN3G0B9_9ACTN